MWRRRLQTGHTNQDRTLDNRRFDHPVFDGCTASLCCCRTMDGSLENALPLPMQVQSIRYPVANTRPRKVAFWVEFGGVSLVVSVIA